MLLLVVLEDGSIVSLGVAIEFGPDMQFQAPDQGPWVRVVVVGVGVVDRMGASGRDGGFWEQQTLQEMTRRRRRRRRGPYG